MRREVKRVALSAAQWICMETPSGPAKPGHLPHRGRLVADTVGMGGSPAFVGGRFAQGFGKGVQRGRKPPLKGKYK